MKKAYIVAAKRTAVGSFNGSFVNTSVVDMAIPVVKDILEITNVPANEIDEVIVGNILPAGMGQGIARQISLGAGIPKEVPAYIVSMVCGSGMKSVSNAYASIQAGLADVVIAGGSENMSMAPYLVPGARQGLRMGNKEIVDHMVFDALTDAFDGQHMGITAERVAEKYSITREEQDEFAIGSQTKALKAVAEGKFKDEITPVTIKQRRQEVVFDTDEYPNAKTTLEILGKLRPAFKKDGTVTAGSASGINDGAAFVMIVSEDALKEYNLKPMAEIVAVGQGGVDPSIMGMGPVPAIKDVLNRADMKLSEMEVLELNEAFAAQSLGVVTELASQHDLTKEEILSRANLNGGAIALGHPVGASGARILVTLVHLLKQEDKEFGLASLCIGGGMGTAVVVKNLK